MVPSADLEVVLAAARARWPQLRVDRERLAARLRSRATFADASGAQPYDADLCLCTALASADPAALAIFESELVPEIDAALARLRLPATLVDEARQSLRVEILVDDGREPRIEGYLGLGPLAAWLRVCATRRALKLLRVYAREESLDDALLDSWPEPDGDLEARHLRATYAAELKAALQLGLAALTVRERNLLRQHLLDDLTVDELALLYRVHRSTCARWIVDARATLGRATRRALSDRLGPREARLESVLRYLDSDVELSLSRLLREPAA